MLIVGDKGGEGRQGGARPRGKRIQESPVTAVSHESCVF